MAVRVGKTRGESAAKGKKAPSKATPAKKRNNKKTPERSAHPLAGEITGFLFLIVLVLYVISLFRGDESNGLFARGIDALIVPVIGLWGAWFLPALLLALAAWFLTSKRNNSAGNAVVFILVSLICVSALGAMGDTGAQPISVLQKLEVADGSFEKAGWVGMALERGFRKVFAEAWIIGLAGVWLIVFMWTCRVSVLSALRLVAAGVGALARRMTPSARPAEKKKPVKATQKGLFEKKEAVKKALAEKKKVTAAKEARLAAAEGEIPEFVGEEPEEITVQFSRKNPVQQDLFESMPRETKSQSKYRLPSYKLLDDAPEYNISPEAHQEQARKVEEVLATFGIEVKVYNIIVGPAVMRLELKVRPGIPVRKIVTHENDIKMGLAVKSVRIEAPIPGKNAVGIEIPNPHPEVVTLKEILLSKEMQKMKSPLAVVLGKDLAGKPILADLKKMPHLLVAGQTGSGKSVCLNAIICSILMRCTPDEVKMILVDPKRVEMTLFEHIPHLLTKLVKDTQKAANALAWAIREMEKRYDWFSAAGVRNLEGYNRKFPEEKLPYVVIVIDELADLMDLAQNDVEHKISRLARLARATGIHMVLATQRPDVRVITGGIKANIPSRLAFTTASYIDSKTILDTVGAEKLLGRGDMLFRPVDASVAQRGQGALITDEETAKLVEFVSGQAEAELDDEVTRDVEEEKAVNATGAPEEEEEHFFDAIRIVVQEGMASASMLQRRLRIGYNRASRLIDVLEEKGIVGPMDGSRPREVLIGYEYLEKLEG